jgi:hypothetical protein
METSSQVVFIILKRGIEDTALLDELNDLILNSNIETIKALITEYPTIHKLICSLGEERRINDKSC